MCVYTHAHAARGDIESDTTGLQVAGADKVGHAVAYGLITMSFLLAVRWPVSRRLWGIIILAVASIGAADELTQPFAKPDCSGWDWTADLIGITLACSILPIGSMAIAHCRRSSQERAVKRSDGLYSRKSYGQTVPR